MAPEQPVRIHEMRDVRAAVHQYIADNAIWRAEDRDLVWSDRLVTARLALLAGQTMSFGELVAQVQSALFEAVHPRVHSLTAELMAEKMCAPL